MTRCFILTLLLSILLCEVQSSKVLVVFPMPAYSHNALGFRIAKELADRGHQVTMITPYPQKTPIKNLRDISVAEHVDYVDHLKKQLFEFGNKGTFGVLNFMFTMGREITERTFQNKQVQELLHSGETFDLVIVEHFLFDALAGIAHHFNAPFILMSPSTSTLADHLFANPAPASYVPTLMLELTSHMNFFQRIQNLLITTVWDLMRELVFFPSQRTIFKKYITTDLELDDIRYNASLLFTNSHLSVNDPVPLVPSIIEIGGFHVYPPKKLPENLQTFFDEAKEGVVLFSMGSNLKSKDLQPEVRKAILNAFSKIKQKVIWKFEAEIPDLPPNVKVMQWLPQQDILAHPNVRAFISHGGLLSTIETVYHGVPIIGIPVFGDQKSNVAAAVSKGYAVGLPLDEISEEKLSWALNEILNNPKYRENVKQRSRLLHDQPLKPIDAAVYWSEHVIRHRGAPHLRSAGLDLTWYQRSMIDIIIFLTLVTIVLFIVFYIIIRKLLGLCSKSKPKPKVAKIKKNK